MINPRKNLHIMLIEDDEALGEAIGGIIQFTGNSVTYCSNGTIAIHKVASSPHRYDAVFTDLQLPEIDGQKVIEKIRQHSKNLPIVVITANADRLNTTTQKSLHIFSLIRKPFDIAELEHVIERVKKIVS